MNRIVREHYPAAKLPEELRAEIGGDATVRVTIEIEDAGEAAPKSDWFSRHEHLRRSNFHSTDEVNAYVRALRDEWGHKDR
jgi:hypothetical protein